MTFELDQWTSTPKPLQCKPYFKHRDITPDVSCVEKSLSYPDIIQPDAISLDVTSLLGNTQEIKKYSLGEKNRSSFDEAPQDHQNMTLTNRIQQQTRSKLEQETGEESKRKEELLTKIGDYLSKNNGALKKAKLHKRLVRRFSTKHLVPSLFTHKTKENKLRLVKPKLSTRPDYAVIQPRDRATGYECMPGLSVFDVTSYIKNGNKCTWC